MDFVQSAVEIQYNCIGALEAPERRKNPKQDILMDTRKGAELSRALTQFII